ncbi:WW domain binding protein [Ceratocystis lukuohia]|uniref:WW domain binding protein n=1 Tax=Ceratocystis lukuohia TaxID=2019550 RepID=A0ABR4MBP0_9PEZI
MVKEKNFNPVQVQRKAEKAKAIKKGKAENQARRDEKLSRRNPARIQKQIDDLKVIMINGGKLSQHEEQVLAGLEKELSAVKKARATLGDKAPVFANPCNDALGKRRRGEGGDGGQRLRRWDQDSTDEDVPTEVRRIPMPRDTPPPIAKEELDKWYAKRRERRAREEELRQIERGGDGSKSIPESSSGTMHDDAGQKAKTREPVAVKKVYEAQPVVRDLVKEAVKAFTPLSVLRKLDKSKGKNGLLEPEEADRLEAQGYLQLNNGISVGGMTDELKATVEDADEDV